MFPYLIYRWFYIFFFSKEHPFIKRHEELEVDVAGYVCNILDQMQAISPDDLMASSSSWHPRTFYHLFRDYKYCRLKTAGIHKRFAKLLLNSFWKMKYVNEIFTSWYTNVVALLFCRTFYLCIILLSIQPYSIHL